MVETWTDGELAQVLDALRKSVDTLEQVKQRREATKQQEQAMFRTRKAKKLGEANYDKVARIANGGERAARDFFSSLGFESISQRRVDMMVRQCQYWVRENQKAWWHENGYLFICGLSQFGPGVEAVR